MIKKEVHPDKAEINDLPAFKLVGEDRFRIALEASPSGMLMSDGRGKILLVNRQIEKLFGYKREELMGQTIEILVPIQLRHLHEGHRKGFFHEPSERPMGAGRDLYGLRKDKTEFPIEIGLNPIKVGEDWFVISSIVDISERKKSEQELARQREELQRTVKELDSFAYSVSHDLKAPLRGIGQVADWVYEDFIGKVGEEEKENLQLMKKRVNRMSDFIDGILRYSRIGRVESVNEWVSLRPLASRVVDSLQPPEHIEVVIEDPLPLVHCIEVQIEQVFQNLIANAIRFMDKSQGKIQIGSRDLVDEYEFHVKDNGPGIAPEHYERIFKIFQTLKPRDEVESTGIGLSIVKKVIELHKGRVWVESKIGEGATFYFTLPKKPTFYKGS